MWPFDLKRLFNAFVLVPLLCSVACAPRNSGGPECTFAGRGIVSRLAREDVGDAGSGSGELTEDAAQPAVAADGRVGRFGPSRAHR